MPFLKQRGEWKCFALAWALGAAEPFGLQLSFPQLHAGLYNKGQFGAKQMKECKQLWLLYRWGLEWCFKPLLSTRAQTPAGVPWKLQCLHCWHITPPPSMAALQKHCSQSDANLRLSWDSSWYDFWSSCMIKPLFFQSSVTQLLSAFLSLTLCSSASFELVCSHFSSYCISCESFILPRSMWHLICRELCL